MARAIGIDVGATKVAVAIVDSGTGSVGGGVAGVVGAASIAIDRAQVGAV